MVINKIFIKIVLRLMWCTLIVSITVTGRGRRISTIHLSYTDIQLAKKRKKNLTPTHVKLTRLKVKIKCTIILPKIIADCARKKNVVLTNI